jgi:soluble lytic murein transglycosylase-like protein
MFGCSLFGPKGLRYMLLLAGLAWAVPAHAQIYSWRDANGTLVVSNLRPASVLPASTASYAVPKAESIRATRYAPAARGRQYDDLISEHSRLNGVRSDLVRAVMQVESAFNPNAKSPKGAIGLMQLMPSTMRQFFRQTYSLHFHQQQVAAQMNLPPSRCGTSSDWRPGCT